MRALLVLPALGALAACASAPPPAVSQSRAEQVLSKVDVIAQPVEVVAADIRFARAARETGQWAAFRAFAADGAVIHWRMEPPIAAMPWLEQQEEEAEASQWAPSAVWASCTGDTAVTYGRVRDSEGGWGQYVTVWQRQFDGDYKWAYFMYVFDPDLTERMEARRDEEPLEEGGITVEAFDDIAARVADCGDEALPAPRNFVTMFNIKHGQYVSRDGSLVWRWYHQTPGGTRGLTVDFVKRGEWEEALAFRVGLGDVIIK